MKGEFMKLRLGYTLKQLLEVYGKKAKVPEILAKEQVFIHGLELWTAYRRKDSWVDEAVEAYLGTELFLRDMQNAEKFWQEWQECNTYWLELVAISTRDVRLIVDMDMKDF